MDVVPTPLLEGCFGWLEGDILIMIDTLVGACFPRPLSRHQTIDLLIEIRVVLGWEIDRTIPPVQG